MPGKLPSLIESLAREMAAATSFEDTPVPEQLTGGQPVMPDWAGTGRLAGASQA
jgi:hypothetical protein